MKKRSISEEEIDHLERNKDAGGSVEVTAEPLQSTALPKLVQNATQSQASKKQCYNCLQQNQKHHL